MEFVRLKLQATVFPCSRPSITWSRDNENRYYTTGYQVFVWSNRVSGCCPTFVIRAPREKEFVSNSVTTYVLIKYPRERVTILSIVWSFGRQTVGDRAA